MQHAWLEARTGNVSSLRVVGRQGRGMLGYTVLLISYKSKPNGPPMQKDKQHFFGLGLGGIITFLQIVGSGIDPPQ